MSLPKGLYELRARVPDTPISKVPDLLEQAYELGKSHGEEASAKTLDLHRKTHIAMVHLLRNIGIVGLDDAKPSRDTPNANRQRGYGDLIGAVTAAIEEIAPTRPFGAVEVHRKARQTNPDITIAQVRSSIKTLTRTSKAERVSKGRYRMVREEPADNGAGAAPKVYPPPVQGFFN